mmetsp:Transcript_5281/g.9125  ORF Transcript_5281/g.9125 Transcript_5281/m.9125 type:complete len:273 (+) Transcript_5281:225-1043(+)
MVMVVVVAGPQGMQGGVQGVVSNVRADGLDLVHVLARPRLDPSVRERDVRIQHLAGARVHVVRSDGVHVVETGRPRNARVADVAGIVVRGPIGITGKHSTDGVGVACGLERFAPVLHALLHVRPPSCRHRRVNMVRDRLDRVGGCGGRVLLFEAPAMYDGGATAAVNAVEHRVGAGEKPHPCVSNARLHWPVRKSSDGQGDGAGGVVEAFLVDRNHEFDLEIDVGGVRGNFAQAHCTRSNCFHVHYAHPGANPAGNVKNESVFLRIVREDWK